jgi:hypothetical protein
MRWLTYEGQQFDLQAATQAASIRDLVELKKTAGISVRTIADTLVGMGEMESFLDIYDSVDRLEVFAAMLFLCKRKAGESFSWDDALGASLVDITLSFEEDEADDPKATSPQTPVELGGEEQQTT